MPCQNVLISDNNGAYETIIPRQCIRNLIFAALEFTAAAPEAVSAASSV